MRLEYVRMSTEHRAVFAKRTNSTPFRQHAAAHNLANRQPEPVSLEKLDIATSSNHMGDRSSSIAQG